MYDLSGMRAGEIESVVMQDWKRLRTELKVLESNAYQKHAGKPLVAVGASASTTVATTR
jgi:hypothetical protein